MILLHLKDYNVCVLFQKFTKDRRTPEGVSYIEEFEVSSDEFIVNYTVGTAVFDRKRVCKFSVFKYNYIYSRTSVARKQIARLPRLFRARS